MARTYGSGRTRRFFETYTRDLKSEDVQRMFTRDTREAYRFFAREIDRDALGKLPWLKRQWVHTGLFVRAFLMRLSPARRVLYGVALGCAIVGMLELFDGFGTARMPLGPVFSVVMVRPTWVDGTMWLFWSLVATNLLVLLEVADRLSLKDDLEVAREIQTAMLPAGTYTAPGVVACGLTRPANTVGGDFFDLLPAPNGELIVALGDVAGKGSPAALLMALLLAMMRTLVDEGLSDSALIARLNVQVSRHSPASRFITLFYSRYDAASGHLAYVNAGHTPALVQRADGRFEQLMGGGVALGMFDGSTYETHHTTLEPGDTLVVYSDGITEAEAPDGQPFEETGLQAVLAEHQREAPAAIGQAVFRAVERHAQDFKLADDLTVLLLTRPAAEEN